MEAGYVPIGNMHACKRSERKCQYGQQTAALAERATSVRSRISVHELASFFFAPQYKACELFPTGKCIVG